MIGAKAVTIQLYHSHPNPKWRPASKSEPLLIAVPGWRCGDKNCPTKKFEEKRETNRN